VPKFTLPRPPKIDFSAPFSGWINKTIERIERKISNMRPAEGWNVDTDLGGFSFKIPTDASFTLADDDGTVKSMTVYPCITWCDDYSGNTGTVRFVFDYWYGNVNQAWASGAWGTPAYEEAASSGNYTAHETMPTDANALTLTDLEPGSYIAVNLKREGTHANDTFTGTVYFMSLTLKYWSDGQLINERVVNETSGQLRWSKRQTNI